VILKYFCQKYWQNGDFDLKYCYFMQKNHDIGFQEKRQFL
jgi:hypothetical protein